MRRVTVRAAFVGACALALSSCAAGSGPDGAAEAVGEATSVETTADAVRVIFAPDPGYEYYERAVLTLGDEVDLIGGADTVDDISEGDRLRIWTRQCAESFPVQCRVDAVEVLD
ncbi:hypothetical protein [Demequina sp. SO4-18]|uniref:hypothetical protein n=1 Tax=Demequina sp. SO4-18 TaxID=3401026 RepID=UPI003B5A9A79